MLKTLKMSLASENFLRAMLSGILTGLFTICLVFSVSKTGNENICLLAGFLGTAGNDLFLILTNVLIMSWAWRQRLKSLIYLVLGLDLAVGVSVQVIKAMKISPWYLRPNGGTGGFPSGHATHAFGMAFLLSMLFPRFTWLWYTCAAAISWSRIETDSHTGLQVTAGIVLGLGIALVMCAKWLGHKDAAVLSRPEIGTGAAIKPGVYTAGQSRTI